MFFSGMSKRQASDYREELESMAQPQQRSLGRPKKSIVAEAVKLRDDGLNAFPLVVKRLKRTKNNVSAH